MNLMHSSARPIISPHAKQDLYKGDPEVMKLFLSSIPLKLSLSSLIVEVL